MLWAEGDPKSGLVSLSSVGPVANAMDVLQPWGLFYDLHPRNDVRDPSSESWNYVGEKVPEFCLNGDFHAILGIFYMP